jgi:hypothetical protein
MLVTVSLLRALKLQAEHFYVAVELDKDTKPFLVERAIREKFGPIADGFKFFWPADGFPSMSVGIEVAKFDVKEAHFPQAGVVTTDPLDHREILMIDGALISELRRFWVYMEAKSIEWRTAYTTSGN